MEYQTVIKLNRRKEVTTQKIFAEFLCILFVAEVQLFVSSIRSRIHTDDIVNFLPSPNLLK